MQMELIVDDLQSNSGSFNTLNETKFFLSTGGVFFLMWCSYLSVDYVCYARGTLISPIWTVIIAFN